MRLSFAGGGTDIPPYCNTRGGAVVSATLNRHSYASLNVSRGSSIRIESTDLGQAIECNDGGDLEFNGILDLPKAVIRRAGREAFETHRTSLLVHTDAPPGSGLGSSSAAAVAMLGVCRRWLDLPWDDRQLAKIACQVEREDLGIPGGYQDQYASVFGGFNFIEFKGSEVSVRALHLAEEIVNELQYSLILCFTGNVAHHTGIIRDQVQRLGNGDTEVEEALDRTKALAHEVRNALMKGDLSGFGKLLDTAWQEKKRFSALITNPVLNQIYEGARRAGAAGGKITGAGGGGHMMFFCDPLRRKDVVKFLGSVGVSLVDFCFEPEGLRTWTVS